MGRLPSCKPALVVSHLPAGDHLAQLGEDQRAEGANQRNEPAFALDVQATEKKNIRRQERNQHRTVQCNLCQDDGILHHAVSAQVDPEGLVEGPRDVAADVLGPYQGNEGDGPCLGELERGIVSQCHDVCLQNLPFTVDDQRDDVDRDDDDREHCAVQHHGKPHPAKDNRLSFRPRALIQDAWLPRLHAQGDGGWQVGDEDQEQDLKRCPHHRDSGDDARKNLHDLRNVHRHDEGHKFLDARVDRAAFLHSRDDRAKVVVGQNHIRCTFCHLRSLDSHGNADVRLVQSRRIVDPITSHGRHLTHALDRLYNFQLVFRLRACEDSHCGREAIHFLSLEVMASGAQGVAVHCCSRLVILWLEDAYVLGDGDGGLQVVSGDHNNADASSSRSKHGVLYAVAVRINGGDQANQPQVLAELRKPLVRGDLVIVLIEGELCHRANSDCEHTQRLAAVFINDLEDVLPCLVRHLCNTTIIAKALLTQVDDEVGRSLANEEVLGTLRQRHAAFANGMPAADRTHREHHLSRRRERNLQFSRIVRGHIFGEADFPCRHDNGSLRRVATGLPLFLASVRVLDLVQRSIAAQQSREQSRLHPQMECGIFTSGCRDLANGRVEALAAHVVGDVTGPHTHHGHLTLGEGSGLVAANHRGRSQSLHRSELADQDVLLDHVAAADGQRDGDTQRDALWDGCHGQGHGNQHHVQRRRALRGVEVLSLQHHTNDENHHAHHDG
mmetsp:Transcript_5158/g.12275  ORF Transcript_5158/g.12275 Transcript_5158/m.12275 type:complete len:726 (-) Transcript_5158:864-3041(-)